MRDARNSFLDVRDIAAVAAKALAGMLSPGEVLAVESPRRRRRLLFGKRSFAVRALAAGVRELLVLAPRQNE